MTSPVANQQDISWSSIESISPNNRRESSLAAPLVVASGLPDITWDSLDSQLESSPTRLSSRILNENQPPTAQDPQTRIRESNNASGSHTHEDMDDVQALPSTTTATPPRPDHTLVNPLSGSESSGSPRKHLPSEPGPLTPAKRRRLSSNPEQSRRMSLEQTTSLASLNPRVPSPPQPMTPVRLNDSIPASSGSTLSSISSLGHVIGSRNTLTRPQQSSGHHFGNTATRSASRESASSPGLMGATRASGSRHGEQATPSPKSTRQARPIPGSPLWRYVKSLGSPRERTRSLSSSAEMQLPLQTPGSGPSRLNIAPPVTPPMRRQQSSDLSSLNISPGHQVATVFPDLQEDASRGDHRSPETHPLNVDIHLRQLEAYARTVPALTTLDDPNIVDNVMSGPAHAVFQLVFFTSLMHVVYRPMDEERTLLLIGDASCGTPTADLQLDFNARPPSHVLCLRHVPEQDCSLLIWGPVELQPNNEVVVRLTFYCSTPAIRKRRLATTYLGEVLRSVQATLAPKYTVRSPMGSMAKWGEAEKSLSQQELQFLFCQLISTVVHELPFQRETGFHRQPVDPVWPVNVTEDSTRAMVEQYLTGQLRLADVMNGGGAVPQCIYLHGPNAATFVGSDDEDELYGGIMNAESDGEPEEEEESKDEGAHQRPRLYISQTQYSTITWSAFKSSSPWPISNVLQSNWQGNMVSTFPEPNGNRLFQANTPTDLSAAGSPPRRARSVDEVPLEQQRTLAQEALEDFYNHRGHSPASRLAFWEQMKTSSPSIECMSFVTVHLWLSSLLADPTRNIMYVDPVLAAQLSEAAIRDSFGLESDMFPLLWRRHLLWPGMSADTRIIVLMETSGLLVGGQVAWLLLDMHFRHGLAKQVNVLVPPATGINDNVLDPLIGRLILALSRVLPRPAVLEKSVAVEQHIKTIVMPGTRTHKSVGLVMLANLCGLMLSQDVVAVDVALFRQSLCYFFNAALKSHDPDTSFPWPGLIDEEGNLLTDKSIPAVNRRRLHLNVNRQPSPFEVFPRRRSYNAALVAPGPSAPFFRELSLPETTFPEDMLIGMSGRSVEALEKAILLGPYPSWPDKLPDQRLQTPDALSLDQFYDLVHSVGGPESEEGQRVLMTGQHDGEHVKLDWLKDSAYLEKEWLMASTDVDSLTLTTRDPPEFLQAGSYYPYPSRAMTITNRNDLQVRVGGKELEMHTCPNFCIMTFGPNNSFRLMVFLPNCKEKVNDRMWRNIAKRTEMRDFYQIFLTAMLIVSTSVPDEWQHAAEKTIEALPESYEAAEKKCVSKGGARVFIGHRIEPQLLNKAFEVTRQIVDTRPEYAKYRDYFFHLCGINLKLATMNIHGREDDNPLNYAFRVNNFIDWYSQNPNNIAVDVGLAINLHRASVPEDIRSSTLLIRHQAFRELLRPAFNTPQQDMFCHSNVVSGARARPKVKVQREGGVRKVQGYLKEMIRHYIHQGLSRGANFTVLEALGLGHRDNFNAEMGAYQFLAGADKSYGIRVEYRATAWAANYLMKVDARELLDRMFDAGVIVCHPTATVASHQVMCSKGWAATLNRQRELPLASRRSPEVMLLASVLSYWLKGLVKRPDDMSSSVQMERTLRLTENAKEYGIPCLRPNALDRTGLRLAYVVQPGTFRILDHSHQIRPGGQKIKSSKAVREIGPAVHPITPPTTPAGPARNRNDVWSEESDDFVAELVRTQLPRFLWERFPDDRKATGAIPTRLRHGPLRIHHWTKLVQPLNTYLVVKNKNKYSDCVDKLFPVGWRAQTQTGEWGLYDRDILRLVRNRVNMVPEPDRPLYSETLRNKIRSSVAAQWDCLPAMQAHKIWTIQADAGKTRIYRLAART